VDGDWKKPIKELKILYGSEIYDLGGQWKRVQQDLNEGAGGLYIYLAYRVEGKGFPITEIKVFDFSKALAPEVTEYEGYTIVRSSSPGQGDLNEGGNSGHFIYIGYKNSTDGPSGH